MKLFATICFGLGISQVALASSMVYHCQLAVGAGTTVPAYASFDFNPGSKDQTILIKMSSVSSTVRYVTVRWVASTSQMNTTMEDEAYEILAETAAVVRLGDAAPAFEIKVQNKDPRLSSDLSCQI